MVSDVRVGVVACLLCACGPVWQHGGDARSFCVSLLAEEEEEEEEEVEVDVDGDDSPSSTPKPSAGGDELGDGGAGADEADAGSEGSEHNAVCQNCGGVGEFFPPIEGRSVTT